MHNQVVGIRLLFFPEQFFFPPRFIKENKTFYGNVILSSYPGRFFSFFLCIDTYFFIFCTLKLDKVLNIPTRSGRNSFQRVVSHCGWEKVLQGCVFCTMNVNFPTREGKKYANPIAVHECRRLFIYLGKVNFLVGE